MLLNVPDREWLSQMIGRDVRTLSQSELKLLINRMENILTQRAKDECLNIATQFYAQKFPREIRDLMYSFLVYSEERPVIGGSPEEDSYGSDFNEEVQPTYHAMDPTYVGEQMAKEITEAYYFGGRFFVPDSKYLEKLLMTDTFGTGVRPLEHVCDIWVLVNYDHSPDTTLNEKRRLHDIHKQMQLLSLIKRTDRLNLQIRLLTKFLQRSEYRNLSNDFSEDTGDSDDHCFRLNDERRMMNLLEAIRQPVYDLLHAGSTVDVLHYNQIDFMDLQDNTGERSLTRFGQHGANEKPKNNFFQLSAEEWQQERAEYGVEGVPPKYMFRTHDQYEDKNYTLNAQDKEELSRRLETRWGKDRALAGFSYPEGYWDDQVEYWVHDDEEPLDEGESDDESDEDEESGDEEMTDVSDEELTETEDA